MKVCRDSFTFLTGLATDVIKTRNKSNKPWVTGGLRKFKKFVVSCIKMANSSLLYKLERNKIVAINKIYRAVYCDNIFKDSTNNKKMWDTINVIIIKKGQSFSIDKLQVNDNNHSQYQMLSTNTSAAFQLNLYLNCPKQITVPRLIWTVKKNRFAFLK